MMGRYDTFKIIIPISKIPEGSTVTKVNGTVEFVVKNEIRLYPEGSRVPTVISADPGTRFMMKEDGSGSVVAETKEVMWETNLNQLNLMFESERSHK